MNGRKAKIILIASILFIFSLILLVISKYNKKDVILNERINKNKSISIMLETDANSGVYEVSEDDEWPDSGYRLNTTRSGCKNGSTISYDTNATSKNNNINNVTNQNLTINQQSNQVSQIDNLENNLIYELKPLKNNNHTIVLSDKLF